MHIPGVLYVEETTDCDHQYDTVTHVRTGDFLDLPKGQTVEHCAGCGTELDAD